MSSLSAEDLERIRNEEIFRQEVRAELEKAKPAPRLTARLWNALNSSFVICLISGTLLVWWTGRLEDAKRSAAEATENLAKSQKLDAEIAERLFAFRTRVQLARSTYGSTSHRHYAQAVVGLVSSQRPDHFLSEYRQRSLRSLLWELHEILSPSERFAVRKALTSLRQLKSYPFKEIDIYGRFVSLSPEPHNPGAAAELGKSKVKIIRDRGLRLDDLDSKGADAWICELFPRQQWVEEFQDESVLFYSSDKRRPRRSQDRSVISAVRELTFLRRSNQYGASVSTTGIQINDSDVILYIQ